MYTIIGDLTEYTKEQLEERFKIVFTITIPYLELMLLRNAENDAAYAYSLLNWALDTYSSAMDDAVRISKHHYDVYYGREKDGVNGRFCKFIRPYDIESEFLKYRGTFHNFDNVPVTWNSRKRWASLGYRVGQYSEPPLLRRGFIDRVVTNVGNVRYWTGGNYMYYGLYSILDTVPVNGSRAKGRREMFVNEANQKIISLSDAFGGVLPF